MKKPETSDMCKRCGHHVSWHGRRGHGACGKRGLTAHGEASAREVGERIATEVR